MPEASMRACLALALILAGLTLPALAAPSQVIILRHGEKADDWRLCPTGQARAAALKANYLGRGAAESLFNYGDAPDAFMAITLHTLELASPAAETWSAPIVLWSVVPEPDINARMTAAALNRRTQEAVADLMRNPRWESQTVVMVWEHHHIADAALDAAYPDEAVTLRKLLKLDRFASVPDTWNGANYDYFWIVDLDAATGEPKAVRTIKQVLPYANGPENDWGAPNGLTAESGCER
jgi:hypothetical protein